MGEQTPANDKQGGLSLHFLGELTVRRSGQVLTLPPSKKTRALLAYLALNRRQFRREHLCELLWEIPDDPRGSLRWSLSKLRRLVDDDGHPRIQADRSHVSMDCSDTEVDVFELQTLVKTDLATAALDDLTSRAEQLCTPFLDDLELPDFHDFYSWCIALREDTKQAQVKLLAALIMRLPAAHAVVYNQKLCTLQPYDVDARSRLITLLRLLHRDEEAENQYRQGSEMLKTAGVDDKGRLFKALRSRPLEAEIPPPFATDVLLPPADHRAHAAGNTAADNVSPNAPRLPAHFAQSLIGRDHEIQWLTKHLQTCCQQRAAAVLLLRGEPGIGKSHLLNNCAAMAREVGATVLAAAAFEAERVRPFAVWDDALRGSLLDETNSDHPSSQERISRNVMFSRLNAALTQQAAQRPLVILLDDIQWCDESSASALHFVLRMNRSQPILVVAAARDTELPGNEALQQSLRGLRRDLLLHERKLEALAQAELAALITRRAPDVDAARLSGECHGNPLLALELARAEQEGGNPGSLNELVEERQSRMARDAVEVLDWAAVLAPRISLHTLERTSKLPREVIDRSMEQAEHQGMLHPGEQGLRFSHDLIAHCIYQNISESRRRAMHRRAAELLATDAVNDLQLAADLAHHAARSGEPSLAASGIIAAARLCLRFYANDDALKLHRQGLLFSDQLSALERVCSKLELAEIRISAAALEDWQAAADELIELAESALDYGALRSARQGYQLASYLRWVHGHCGEALNDSLQGERVTRGGSVREQVVGRAEAAKCLALLERDLPQADAMIMEAEALAKRQSISCAAIPTCLGILRYYEGQWDLATEHLQEARAMCKGQGDRVSEFLANEYLAITDFERGDYQLATRHTAAMQAIASRLREGSEAPMAEAMGGLCRYALDGEAQGLDQACARLRAVDAKQRLAYMLNRIARLDLQRSDWDAAERHSKEAMTLAQTMERPTETLLACLHQAAVKEQRMNVADFADDPLLEHIRTLSAGTVAGWARKHAQQLLARITERLEP